MITGVTKVGLSYLLSLYEATMDISSGTLIRSVVKCGCVHANHNCLLSVLVTFVINFEYHKFYTHRIQLACICTKGTVMIQFIELVALLNPPNFPFRCCSSAQLEMLMKPVLNILSPSVI